MQKIAAFKSLNSLSHGLKNEALTSYDIPCRTGNCFICVHSRLAVDEVIGTENTTKVVTLFMSHP